MQSRQRRITTWPHEYYAVCGESRSAFATNAPWTTNCILECWRINWSQDYSSSTDHGETIYWHHVYTRNSQKEVWLFYYRRKLFICVVWIKRRRRGVGWSGFLLFRLMLGALWWVSAKRHLAWPRWKSGRSKEELFFFRPTPHIMSTLTATEWHLTMTCRSSRRRSLHTDPTSCLGILMLDYIDGCLAKKILWGHTFSQTAQQTFQLIVIDICLETFVKPLDWSLEIHYSTTQWKLKLHVTILGINQWTQFHGRRIPKSISFSTPKSGCINSQQFRHWDYTLYRRTIFLSWVS